MGGDWFFKVRCIRLVCSGDTLAGRMWHANRGAGCDSMQPLIIPAPCLPLSLDRARHDRPRATDAGLAANFGRNSHHGLLCSYTRPTHVRCNSNSRSLGKSSIRARIKTAKGMGHPSSSLSWAARVRYRRLCFRLIVCVGQQRLFSIWKAPAGHSLAGQSQRARCWAVHIRPQRKERFLFDHLDSPSRNSLRTSTRTHTRAHTHTDTHTHTERHRSSPVLRTA